MLTTKLARIKELIEQKERIDTELSQLLGETEKPRRTKPPKKISHTTDGESGSCGDIGEKSNSAKAGSRFDCRRA